MATKQTEEYEAPTPTQAELNAINRRIHGLKDEEKPAEEKAETKDAKPAEKPAPYQTRQAKAD